MFHPNDEQKEEFIEKFTALNSTCLCDPGQMLRKDLNLKKHLKTVPVNELFFFICDSLVTTYVFAQEIVEGGKGFFCDA